ncbi:MAG: hypothetical protein ACYCQI_02410 [Gammaproteobacteria bacterium]
MKYIEEFRNSEFVKALAEIAAMADKDRHYHCICNTHLPRTIVASEIQIKLYLVHILLRFKRYYLCTKL